MVIFALAERLPTSDAQNAKRVGLYSTRVARLRRLHVHESD